MPVVRISKRLVVAIILAAGLASVVPHWAAGQTLPGTCKSLWAELETAAEARNLNAARDANRKLQGQSGCNALRVDAKAVMLDLYREEVARMEKAGAPAAARLAALTTALLQYGNAWDLRVKIADLERRMPGASGRPDYAAISQAYHDALQAVEDGPPSARPPAAELERVAMLAYQFQALSPTPVRGRGLFTRNVRRIFVERTLVPLPFVYDSDRMTELGRAEAERMSDELEAEGNPRIRLVGHTDPKGSHDYNDRLSVRRANAVRDFLIARGYPTNRITTEGRGERDIGKLEIVDRAEFTVDQIHRMLRRVEIVWKQ